MSIAKRLQLMLFNLPYSSTSSFSVFFFSLPDSPSCSPLAILLSLPPMHSLVATHSNCGLCLQLYGGHPAATPIPCTTLGCSMFAAACRGHVVLGHLVPGCAGITSVMPPVCGCVPLAGDIYGSLESLGGRVGC